MVETRAKQTRAAKQTAAERAASAIRKGDMDAEMHLIVNAVTDRVSSGEVTLNWRVDLDDIHASEEDLTLGEAEMLEKILGCTWGEMDPLTSAEHATALLRVLLTERVGLPLDEARDRVKGYTAKQVMASITREAEVDPPKG